MSSWDQVSKGEVSIEDKELNLFVGGLNRPQGSQANSAVQANPIHKRLTLFWKMKED